MFIPFVAGVTRSKADPRDWMYAKIAAVDASTLPIKFRLPIPAGYVIRDQGQRGTCVGQTYANLDEFLQTKERKTYVGRRSAEFIWNLCKLNDQFPDSEGTDLRTACQMIVKYGICPEEYMPYTFTSHPAYMPPQAAITAAYPDRMLGYARISTLNEFKQALAEQQIPIPLAIIVTESMQQMQKGVFPMPQGSIFGGHAMLGIGYDDETRMITVINSWGTGAPTDNGLSYIPYDYIFGQSDTFPYLIDAFTMVDLIEVKPTTIPDTITPDKDIITVMVNGVKVDVQDALVFKYADRVYVPLRFVAQALGCLVDWDETTKTVRISTDVA